MDRLDHGTTVEQDEIVELGVYTGFVWRSLLIVIEVVRQEQHCLPALTTPALGVKMLQDCATNTEGHGGDTQHTERMADGRSIFAQMPMPGGEWK